MGVTLAARKPPPKQQTTDKPPEVPQAAQGGYITTVFGSNIDEALPDLIKMSSTTASESSGRIPELKTTAAVSSSTSGTPTSGPQTSSLLVSQHPLLCSLLLPLPTAACGHPKKATKPRGWGGRGLEEPRVESQTSSFYVLSAREHYGIMGLLSSI